MMTRGHLRVGLGYLRRTLVLTGLSSVLLLGGSMALAHHSYAMFDMQKIVEVRGTIKEFRFVNPHSWIVLYVKDDTGKSADFRIETNGPYYLAKLGWKHDSLQTGDKITASINPLRDGAPGGSLIKVTLNDGRELNARTESPTITKGDTK